MLVVERVRRIFDLTADPLQIANHLARDAWLTPMLQARPGLRVPGVWDAFELAVRAVLGQQLTSVDSRSAIARVVHCFGKSVRTSSPICRSSIARSPAGVETFAPLSRQQQPPPWPWP